MTVDRSGALLELLIQVNREVAAALDLRTVLQRLVFAAMKYVGGERGSIVVLDDMGKAVDATIVYGTTLFENTTQQIREIVDRGLAGWVIRNRKAALVPDTSKDERWIQRPDDAKDRSGAKSALCVPLVARERLVGVLTLVHSFPNSFGPEQLELTKAIADQASIAVLNARLYTESSRHVRVMTALADGAATINSSLDLHEIWQRVLNQTIQAMQVETAALGLIEGPEQNLVYRAATGQNAGSIVDRRIPAGQGLVGQVVREGHGFVLPDARVDKRFTDIDRFTGIEARAVALAPIQAQSRTIGVLVAINPVSKSFDTDTITVLTGIGGLAGTTISNAQLYERLQIAHQHYRRLFEESIDPIFITDWEGRITEPNREAVRISGYTADQLHEMSVDQLHEVNWGRVGLEFEKLRDQNQRIYESVLQTAESGKVPVEVHVRRVEFEDTDSIQWTFRDITERRELDSLRENLTSMIYHDLRSPLGNIVASLDVLNGTIAAAEPAHSMLNVARHSTDRIQRLVDSLLDINRLESGQTILTPAFAKPGEIIKNAVIDVTPIAQARHQTILTEIQNDLPQIRVD